MVWRSNCDDGMSFLESMKSSTMWPLSAGSDNLAIGQVLGHVQHSISESESTLSRDPTLARDSSRLAGFPRFLSWMQLLEESDDESEWCGPPSNSNMSKTLDIHGGHDQDRRECLQNADIGFAKTPLHAAARLFTPLASQVNSTSHQFNLDSGIPLASKIEALSDFDKGFAYVINDAAKLMRVSQLTANVLVSDSLRDCAIIIQPHDDSVIAEEILELALKALMDAARKSRAIYVMGFRTSEPFVMCPLGFEATLGAMESAHTACWHLFKKGFCRHAESCCKQHPACKIPVRILVDKSLMNAPLDSICDFNLKVADFISDVVFVLQGDISFACVEARQNEATTCWTIQLTPSTEGIMNEEYLLCLAKSKMLMLVPTCDVCILGRHANPFVSRPNGCMVVLGDMPDEACACPHFYSKGFCRKGCDCALEHPHCTTPIHIIINSGLPSKTWLDSDERVVYPLPVGLVRKHIGEQINGADLAACISGVAGEADELKRSIRKKVGRNKISQEVTTSPKCVTSVNSGSSSNVSSSGAGNLDTFGRGWFPGEKIRAGGGAMVQGMEIIQNAGNYSMDWDHFDPSVSS